MFLSLVTLEVNVCHCTKRNRKKAKKQSMFIELGFPCRHTMSNSFANCLPGSNLKNVLYSIHVMAYRSNIEHSEGGKVPHRSNIEHSEGRKVAYRSNIEHSEGRKTVGIVIH